MKFTALLVASCAAVASAFQPMARVPTRSVARMADEKFFDNGGKGRLGTSVDQVRGVSSPNCSDIFLLTYRPTNRPTDPLTFISPLYSSSLVQDGKSNVWAVEPKMQVEVEKEGGSVMKGGIVAGGAVAAIALAGVVVANLPDFDAI